MNAEGTEVLMKNQLQPISTVTLQEPYSNITEAFRTLRTSIKYSAFDKGKQVIMITSSIPSEGKTSTVSNLGILSAQDGKEVLLIDGDLRIPNLHHIFNSPNRTGLSAVLAGYTQVADAIQHTDVPRLSILPAGPIQLQPAELLGSARLEQVINQLRNQYDIIIIDSPPILAVTDATLIARVADGIVLIVRSALTRRDQLKKTQKNLLPFKDKILGIVMNDREDHI
jgi:capsular exopolysaccharide synthesis family protein